MDNEELEQKTDMGPIYVKNNTTENTPIKIHQIIQYQFVGNSVHITLSGPPGRRSKLSKTII